jgi:hypothetical protein
MIENPGEIGRRLKLRRLCQPPQTQLKDTCKPFDFKALKKILPLTKGAGSDPQGAKTKTCLCNFA